MIADALQRLGGKKDVEILLSRRTVRLGQMPVKQRMAQPVYFRIGLKDALCVRHVTLEEALMNLLQHFAKQRSHLHELSGVRCRQFFAARLQLHGRIVGEVSDALEVGDELQTREQLTRLGFPHAGDGFGQLVINLALDLVEFFLAILDREKSQARTVLEKVPDIEYRVAGDQAAAHDQGRQFISRQIFIAGLSRMGASLRCSGSR